MLFTGRFRRAVDDKQRLAIPKRLRILLEKTKAEVLYIAPGTDGSLAIYTEQGFDSLAEKLAKASPTGPDVRAFSRMFYAQAERVELDGQGRIRIPPELFQLAELGKEVVLVGVRDHLEVWDAKRWDDYLSEQSNQYDSIAARAFDVGTTKHT